MILCFEGQLGSGKTTSAAELLLRWFRADLDQVFTDMTSLRIPGQVWLDPQDPNALARVSRGVVFLDECGIVLNSRLWQQVPAATIEAFTQLRKNRCDLVFTVPDLLQVDSRLRQVTQHVVRCRQLGGAIQQTCVQAGGKDALWRRLLWPWQLRGLWKLFDTYEKIERASRGDQVSRAEWLDDLRERRRRQPERVRRWRQAGRHPFAVPIWECSPFGGHYQLTAEARIAEKALRWEGYLLPGEAEGLGVGEPGSRWGQLVAGEVARRRWLRFCGLRPGDAPMTCTYERPWAVGFAPDEVRERAHAADCVRAQEILANAAEADRKARTWAAEVLAGGNGRHGR